MMPGAGLFLRDSLYPKPSMMESAEIRSVQPKTFERRSVNLQSRQDSTNTFTSISTVFKFVDFVAALNGVSSETKIFVNLIQRVRDDLSEALRLHACSAVADYFEAFPYKKSWIDNILLDIQRALNDIGAYVEDVREGEDEGGAARMKHRFEWVLTHHQKLISREIALNTCHQSLMAAIQAMQAAELSVQSGGSSFAAELPVPQPPTLPWLQDDGILRSPYSRQKWRMSQKNLSLPSITVSEFGSDASRANSVNSSPVELPGSTPDDLPDPDNWDLYAAPISGRRSLDQLAPSFSISRKPVGSERVPPPLPTKLGTLKLARRYKPKAVDVRRPVPKHNSLPSELPFLPRQPSLYLELADYVLPSSEWKLEEPQYKPQDVGTPAKSATSSPDELTSVMSCPNEPLTNNPRKNSVPVVISTTEQEKLNDGVLIQKSDNVSNIDERLETKEPLTLSSSAEQHLDSSKMYKAQYEPHSGSQRIDPSEQNPISQTVSNSERSSASPIPITGSPCPVSSVDPAPAFAPEPGSIPAVQESVSSNPRDSKFSQANSPVEKSHGPKSSATSSPIEVDKADFSSFGPIKPDPPPVPPALTAQAKRRRAQARRMQMAYGSE